jgi:hypothetical protein
VLAFTLHESAEHPAGLVSREAPAGQIVVAENRRRASVHDIVGFEQRRFETAG